MTIITDNLLLDLDAGKSLTTSAAKAGAAAIMGAISIILERKEACEELVRESEKIIRNIKKYNDSFLGTEAKILRAVEIIKSLFNANKAFVQAYVGLRDMTFKEPMLMNYLREASLNPVNFKDPKIKLSLQHLVLVCKEYNKINEQKVEQKEEE